MIADPLQEVLGGLGYEFLIFEMFDYDGAYSRGLKEDWSGRIGIEAISILTGNYMWRGYLNMTTMMWFGILIKALWRDLFEDLVLISSNEAEYAHLTASEWQLWKIIEK